MNLDVSFEKKDEHLHVIASGEWLLEDVKELFSLVREKADTIGHRKVLLDMRKVGNLSNEMDRFHTAEHAVKVFNFALTVAVLGQTHSITKMAEDIAVNRGMMLLVTGDEAEAHRWLLAQ
ncbi:MAG: hypothetical protein JKY51_04750 [Opitutaceae bacterium]|nr:hypothetical protein [Opitutaceae bacterium]